MPDATRNGKDDHHLYVLPGTMEAGPIPSCGSDQDARVTAFLEDVSTVALSGSGDRAGLAFALVGNVQGLNRAAVFRRWFRSLRLIAHCSSASHAATRLRRKPH